LHKKNDFQDREATFQICGHKGRGRVFLLIIFQKVGFSSLKKTISNLFEPVPEDNLQTRIANFDPLKQVTVKHQEYMK